MFILENSVGTYKKGSEKMDFPDEHIIENIYNTDMLSNVACSEKYKKLLHRYNQFYDSITDEELKEQFSKLEEIRTDLFSQNDKDLFKVGFSMAIKIIVEALTCEI